MNTKAVVLGLGLGLGLGCEVYSKVIPVVLQTNRGKLLIFFFFLNSIIKDISISPET